MAVEAFRMQMRLWRKGGGIASSILITGNLIPELKSYYSEAYEKKGR